MARSFRIKLAQVSLSQSSRAWCPNPLYLGPRSTDLSLRFSSLQHWSSHEASLHLRLSPPAGRRTRNELNQDFGTVHNSDSIATNQKDNWSLYFSLSSLQHRPFNHWVLHPSIPTRATSVTNPNITVHPTAHPAQSANATKLVTHRPHELPPALHSI